MKSKFLFIAFLVIAILTACSSKPSYEIDVTKPLYFQKDKQLPFEVTVKEDGQLATGLKVKAQLSMAGMDHGTYDVEFTEEKNGAYSGEAGLPMDGDYEFIFTIEKDGQKTEKVIDYTVKKSKGIASINGEWINEEDLEFYRFINELHIAISRETDKEKYKGKALEEALAFWDAQEKLNQDKNQLLTQIIRLRSMAMLALEKGHHAKQEEIDQEIKKVREQYHQHVIANKLIKEFDEDKFWEIEKKQYELIVLSQKVQNDLVEKVRKENPKATEQEIVFLAQREYEELLVSQVNSLKIEIL